MHHARWIPALLTGIVLTSSIVAGEPPFPVTPTLFIDSFKGAEGIAFSAEGNLFIAADKARVDLRDLYIQRWWKGLEASGGSQRAEGERMNLGLRIADCTNRIVIR